MTAVNMRFVEVSGLNQVDHGVGEVPQPGPKEARIAVELAGICGSDTHAVAGEHPFLIPPYLPGHELTGRIDALGSDVTGFEVGERVMIKPNIECGECVNCLAGRGNACQTLQWIGCDPSGKHPGGMAEFVLAPEVNIFSIPEDISEEDAVLIEALATAVHAVRIAGDVSGQKVVVVGAGTIGLLTLLAARRAGAEKIVVTDLDESMRDRALSHGADETVAADRQVVESVKEALGGTADVVFDCVAIEQTLQQSLSMLRRAGTMVVVGVPPRDATLPLPYIQDWELRVQGSANYNSDDIRTAISIAVEGGIPGSEIVTGRYAIEDAEEAFEVAAEGTSGKVVIDPKL